MALCEHFGTCGGCSYLDTPYEEELKMKAETVRELLLPFGGEYEGILPAPSPSAYRNKMEFAFGDEHKDGPLALGIRKRRNFYEVATPRNCALIPGAFKEILLTVLQYFREAGEAFFHRRRHTGSLRHLVLRRGEFTGEILVNLSTSSGLCVPLEPLIEKLSHLFPVGTGKTDEPLRGGERPGMVGFLHSVNDGVSDAVKPENVKILYGRDFLYEKICGLTFKISAFSFFQTNSAGAERLYEKINAFVRDTSLNQSNEFIYDLYCGTGTISQIVSPHAKQVVGVELSEEAVLAARENASAINKIANCEFIAGDALRVADELSARAEKPGTIIVDPPRDGLHPKALPKIAGLGASRIIYVSCKPASLARDLALLSGYGYAIKKSASVDMFPRTPNIETVCRIEK
ncbi:MAG: 23S rRNA (uracil(1939)-C(5))-methyltransferase RlmD [Clostridiales bacterium]|jgi:23S rRNA (uracil-5-)-methyltransferase RumA|nr:23S rRNA (uracil(1939)-C(5))-methyltransferase RlmD [Clostridiales bacterium]